MIKSRQKAAVIRASYALYCSTVHVPGRDRPIQTVQPLGKTLFDHLECFSRVGVALNVVKPLASSRLRVRSLNLQNSTSKSWLRGGAPPSMRMRHLRG